MDICGDVCCSSGTCISGQCCAKHYPPCPRFMPHGQSHGSCRCPALLRVLSCPAAPACRCWTFSNTNLIAAHSALGVLQVRPCSLKAVLLETELFDADAGPADQVCGAVCGCPGNQTCSDTVNPADGVCQCAPTSRFVPSPRHDPDLSRHLDPPPAVTPFSGRVCYSFGVLAFRQRPARHSAT